MTVSDALSVLAALEQDIQRLSRLEKKLRRPHMNTCEVWRSRFTQPCSCGQLKDNETADALARAQTALQAQAWQPIDEDARKFLTLLLTPCPEGDWADDDHAWRECPRCLAMNDVENRDKLARRFIEHAISRLPSPPTEGPR